MFCSGLEGGHAQEHTAAEEAVGRDYGLTLRWGKVQLARVRSTQCVAKPDGSPSEAVPSMTYLGSWFTKTEAWQQNRADTSACAPQCSRVCPESGFIR